MTRLARIGSAALLVLAAVPMLLVTPCLAGEWFDPSGMIAIPQVQNAICKYSGIDCARQNRIRLDTLDYRANFEDPLPFANDNTGWEQFASLGSIYGDQRCIDYTRIGYIISHYGTFDGNLLHFSGDSPFNGKFDEQWDFRPVTGWVAAEAAPAGYRATLGAGRQLIFDYLASTRDPMPRDVAISIHLQVFQDGMPRPDLENTYQVTFPSGQDEFSNSCVLPALAPGNYQLTFLVSDDFFGEDKPISVDLTVSGR